MGVLVVSGIWPPDVGGPASHGPGLGRFLADRGHRVTGLASVSEPPVQPGFPLVTASRDRPLPVRWMEAEAKLLRLARRIDVIYATGLYHRSALAATAARVPMVVKLVNDPAFERARNSGRFHGTLEEFQVAPAGGLVSALKRMRDAMLARAGAIIVPSHYLAEIVRAWLPAPRSITVIPNPAPAETPLPGRDELRLELGVTGPSIVFAGRFVLQKNLPLLIAALRDVPDATLWLVGDGPEAGTLRAAVDEHGVGERVRMLPAVARAAAVRWMKAADVTVLPSSWENFPHAAVESLTVGTPVVATAVGGVPEIVEAEVNGLLVESGDRDGLAVALRRALHDAPTNRRLLEGAAAVGDRFSPDRLYEAAEDVILACAGWPHGRSDAGP